MIEKKKKKALANSKGFTNGNVRTKGLANSRGLINGKGLINGRRGLINGEGVISGRRGLINGKGLINGRRGIINGKGLINGRRGLIKGGGLVNGRPGLVNGNGFTNGLRLRKNPFGIVTHRELRIGLIFIVVLILLLPGISLLVIMTGPPPPVQKGINVDGDFTDWASVPKYSEALSAPPDNINLLNYAIDLTDGILSFYIKVKGNFFTQEDPDMFEIFIDADGDRRTGYKISEDFGSDYRIELYGWNGTVKKSILSGFSVYEPDRLNYSSWSSNEGAKAAISLNELEAQIDTGMLDGFQEDDFKVSIYGKDFEGREVYSSVTPSISYGALVVEQKPILQNPVVSSSQDVTQLLFTAKGSDVNVTSLTITASAGTVENIAPFTVPAESTLAKYANLDATGLSDEIFVSVNLNAVEADKPVRIIGSETRVYVGNYHSGIVVDGLFEDWKPPINTSNDAMVDVNNTNIDVSKYSTAKNSTNANFYIKVAGNLFAGTSIPRRVSRPEPGVAGPSGPPAPPAPPVTYVPRNSGEDVTRIYIDSNISDTVGAHVSGILADYMVEIKGIHGKITNRAFYNWTNSQWNLVSTATVEAEIDETQLESSIPLAYLGAVNNPEVLFVTTDWRGLMDTTAEHEGLKGAEEGSTKEGTKGPGGPLILVTWPSTWTSIITDSSTDETSGDQSLNILELYQSNESATYLFIRIRTNQTSGAPDIDNNSWGVYLNTDGVAGNDYLIQENGTGGTSFWTWDSADWDWDSTYWEADLVRTTTMTVSSIDYGVVDIAIRRGNVTGLTDDDTIQGFAHDTNNYSRSSDPVRDPTDVSPSPNNDVTGPATIPEFQEIIIPFSIAIAIPLAIWRRKKK